MYKCRWSALGDGSDAAVSSRLAYPEVRALAVGTEQLFAAWDQRLRSAATAPGIRLAPDTRPA